MILKHPFTFNLSHMIPRNNCDNPGPIRLLWDMDVGCSILVHWKIPLAQIEEKTTWEFSLFYNAYVNQYNS